METLFGGNALARKVKEENEMNRRATDIQESVPSPPLPADHVLSSGAVLFPGAFDQHGCPLIVFPVDGQDKLCSDLSKTEVADFITYFLRLHNKKQDKDCLVSVVADLRHASLPTARFVAETVLLLEQCKRTVHTVYIIQAKKKEVVKLLLKLLAPKSYTASFKKILLKEIPELSNFIDRSQLPASLGGYFIYCHHSWVTFIKEIDTFGQEFVSVVQRLPACISTLQSLSRLPPPTTSSELQHFCSTNEAKFQQLRRELGLDELLRHCESVVEKLRYPEKDPCYQAMAGTALFTHTAFDMLQNYSRITAAVEKVELLWQQAFSKARLQLQVFQLREDALQITGQIETLLLEKLQPYRVEIAKDAATAGKLLSEFEMPVHTPAMALVRCAEDVIHTLVEILPLSDSQTRERWVLDLETLKEKLHSTVQYNLQTLRAVSSYHHYYNKANRWYSLVLRENFLQELLSGVDVDSVPRLQQGRSQGSVPAWRQKLSGFLKKNPPPDMEELVHLAHLSNVIPDGQFQQAGKQLSHRCMTLRKLLISAGPVAVGHLKLALQWQYELLLGSHINQSSADRATNGATEDVQETHNSVDHLSTKHRSEPHIKDDTQRRVSESNLTKCDSGKEAAHSQETSPSVEVSAMVSAECKPPSLSSFDSGFDGAGSSQLEAGGGREGWEGVCRLVKNRDSVRPAISQPDIHEENICSVSDSEDSDPREEFDFGSVGNSSRASIQIIPKVTVDSLNFEIKVKRSAALPTNPWLSLPVDDLENSYTVTITQNPPAQQRDPKSPHSEANQSSKSRDQPTQTEISSSAQSRQPQARNWRLHSQSSFEDPDLSPICNVLSSTITDGRDKASCTIEGIPTLLWDSYDLHDQNQDAVECLNDVSLKDWVVKEQEGLREVEKILDRADEILEEEENVLAQEAELDALLRSESRQNHWALWDGEGQLGVMSTSELAESGVLGLEDFPISAELENLSEQRTSRPASESKASDDDDDGHYNEDTSGADTVAPCSRPDLLTELRQVHILDEMIMEENLKIHKLRCCEENPSEDLPGRKPSDGPGSMSKERQLFRLQLEKEKREVEKLEKSLNKELDQELKTKKHKSRPSKVLKSSIMEKTKTDILEEQGALCDELISNSGNQTQSAQQLTFIVQHESQAQDICQIESARAELGPDVANKTTTMDLTPFPASPCQDDTDMTCNLEEHIGFTITTYSELKEPSEEVRVESVNQEQLGGRSDENASICKPEASLTPEMRPDDGAFDPGGKSQLPPVPKPRKALFTANNSPAEHESPYSTETTNTSLSSVAQDSGIAQPDPQENPDSLLKNETPANCHKFVPNQNVNEDSNNNNNNHQLPEKYIISAESYNNSTDVSTENRKPSPSQVPPDLPTACDPSRTEERNEDVPDGFQTTEASCMSPGIQVQLNINTTQMTDFKTPIVLDTGSGLMKAGFADQNLPNIVFPTIIGVPKYEEIMNGNLERETYIGHEAQHMRGVLTLKHPIKNGIIRNWDDMENIWHHTFQQLSVHPEDHPVLLTEAAMNPLENRQRMVQVMFEYFNVPFTYVAMQAVLALYATGRSTGVVFDSGDGVSHSVPVCEGYCLPHAVQRLPLAGADVTMHLKKLLQEQGVCMRTTAEMEIVREMKEKCCCVALDYEAELTQGGSSCREMLYTLPDGQIVSLTTERFRASEILFKPELIGRDHYGMHESIFKSILSSDIDLRRGFLGNIILSGGNTLLPGLPERLEAEIKGMVPSDMSECVRISSPKDRDFSVWSGGAVLANLPSFNSAWISQEEYDEFGPQIVFRKCF
ncbi:hypothetical protein LDENG_00013510 [Lucifuga dentata]|nr:hypothetical protein LDENG_00013510 [Lucifuga dentata]